MTQSKWLQVAYFASASLIAGGLIQWINNKYSLFAQEDEYTLVRRYLLNNNPLYGQNLPKLWLYTDSDRNALDWKNTSWRTNTRLNRPYLYSSISSIVEHCSTDFHICLIDKDSFVHLIPGFESHTIGMSCEQKKYYGLTQLLYYYGGISIPISFVCRQSFKKIYDEIKSKPESFFCGETIVYSDSNKSLKPELNLSLLFMGGIKHSEQTKEISEFIRLNPFPISWTHKCREMIENGKLHLIPGEFIGTRDQNGQLISTEKLLQREPITFHNEIAGVYFSDEEIRQTFAYEYFLFLSRDKWLEDPSNLGEQFRLSAVQL